MNSFIYYIAVYGGISAILSVFAVYISHKF
ncbi:hypothetical protein [Campylobacter phage CJLB-12]|nr:hypothetical protein [Campylobacter phage CJLB-12]